MIRTFITVLFAILIFAGFSFYTYSEICCMFSASRYYGWPYSYLVLNKSVDSYLEAERVKSDSALVLMEDGWKLSFSTHMTKGLLGSAILSLLADLVASFFITLVLLFGFDRIKGVKQHFVS